MGQFIDLTGRRYDRLTVLSRDGKKNGEILWLCQCDCGNSTTVRATSLRYGSTGSCGCKRRESSARRTLENMRNALNGRYRVDRVLDDVFNDDPPAPDDPPRTFPGCEQALAALSEAWAMVVRGTRY